MNFKEALQKLGIEDYGDRIFHSNSNGELFHLNQYIGLAEYIQGDVSLFKEWFDGVVKEAEENWERPESVFQHIGKIFLQQLEDEERQSAFINAKPYGEYVDIKMFSKSEDNEKTNPESSDL